MVEPAILVLGVVQQEVQVVVAEDALRSTILDKPFDQGDNPRAVWPTIRKVAQKDDLSALRVPAQLVVAQVSEECAEHLKLAMDIPDDIERTVK
jgi:hypothetical protein